MSSEHTYTPEEAASVALARWNDEAAGLWHDGAEPSVYIRRAREDAALSTFGDFMPNLGAAEALFRDGVESYLKHQKAGTEADGFYRAFVGKLDALVPGVAGVAVAKVGAVTAEGFWPRLEQRIDGARQAFAAQTTGSALSDERRQAAAMFTSAVVAAGELVGRGRVSKEAVLPMRMLERMPTLAEMRTSAVPGRCASVYARALESVSVWQQEAAALCAKMGNTTTAAAIAPILVSARGPMTLAEFKDASGRSRNTAETFLEQLRQKGVVSSATAGDRGKTYAFVRSAVLAARGPDARELATRRDLRKSAALPSDKTAERSRSRAR